MSYPGTWLTSVGGVDVERYHPHYVSGERVVTGDPRQAVQHTTEGGWDGSHSVFVKSSCPTFMLGRDGHGQLRCIQYAGIGVMAYALKHPSSLGFETNRAVMAQIELVAFRKTKPWLPDAATTRLLAALYAAIADKAGVPLRRGGDGTRSPRRWLREAGWFGHIEVPGNDHTDPGALEYDELFRLAHAPAPHPRYRWDVSHVDRTSHPALAHTLHPAVWSTRHPRTFRQGDVTFSRKAR